MLIFYPLKYEVNTLELLNEDKNFKRTFPKNNGISDIVLFINKEIRENTDNGSFQSNIDDLIEISNPQMFQLLKNVREKYQKGFSKEYQEMDDDKVFMQVVSFS